MKKNELRIDMSLQEPQCTMIRPWYTYQKDGQGMSSIWRKKVERDPNNLVLLENTISQRMQRLYQDQILEILEKKIPILYIDCQNTWDYDIMFYIFIVSILRVRIVSTRGPPILYTSFELRWT